MQKIMQAGLSERIEVDSAGTASYHVDEAPDARATVAAARRGVDLTSLRGRKVIREDFQEYDYVLPMDRQNIADLRRIAPENYQGCLGLLMDFAGRPDTEVPDPYQGGEQGFEQVLDMIEAATDGLLREIEARL